MNTTDRDRAMRERTAPAVTGRYINGAPATALELAVVRETVDAVGTRLDDVDRRVSVLEGVVEDDAVDNRRIATNNDRASDAVVVSHDVPAEAEVETPGRNAPSSTQVSLPGDLHALDSASATRALPLVHAPQIVIQLTDGQFSALIGSGPTPEDAIQHQTDGGVVRGQARRKRARGR